MSVQLGNGRSLRFEGRFVRLSLSVQLDNGRSLRLEVRFVLFMCSLKGQFVRLKFEGQFVKGRLELFISLLNGRFKLVMCLFELLSGCHRRLVACLSLFALCLQFGSALGQFHRNGCLTRLDLRGVFIPGLLLLFSDRLPLVMHEHLLGLAELLPKIDFTCTHFVHLVVHMCLSRQPHLLQHTQHIREDAMGNRRRL